MANRKTTECRTDEQLAKDLQTIEAINRRWNDDKRAKAVMEAQRKQERESK